MGDPVNLSSKSASGCNDPCQEERTDSEVDPLLERLKAGDDEAYALLISRHGGRVLAAARKMLGNEEDARDAVQETFLSAFKAIDRFDGRSSLATWLHRIVVNAALMKLRAKQSRIQEDLHEHLPEFIPAGAFAEHQGPWGELPEDNILREELREKVLEAIAELPEKYREALLLRDIEGLSNPCLAKALGISVNAAKIRIHRARQALRTLLEPMCLM